MRVGLAFVVFFRIIFNAAFAKKIRQIDEGSPAGDDRRATGGSVAVSSPQKTAVAAPGRSEAVTLLATLQREARFVDLVKEQLGDYSDEQVGAAARDVIRDCAAVLERMFGINPIVSEEEGAQIETPKVIDPMRYRLTGNVHGDAPLRGELVHHGWEATRCDVPAWSGSDKSSLVVAPVELEI